MHASVLLLLSPVIVSLIVTLVLCQLIVGRNWSFIPADIPNKRSLHSMPIPRAGGLAISIGIYLAFLVLLVVYGKWDTVFAYPLFSVLLVTSVSLIDDYRNLSFLIRILFHFIAAGVIAFLFTPFVLVSLDSQISSAPLFMNFVLMLIIVWFMNIYNFMDGSDGLAAMMALIGFTTFALLGMLGGHTYYIYTSLIIVAACIGFLCFNFPPARLFMGDSGSIQLGLLICIFSIWGAGERVFPFYIPFILFSAFIYDTSITLLRRAWHREKLWLAHKTHFYQQLIDAGWSHKQLLLAEALLMLVCAMACLVLVKYPDLNQTLIITGIIVLYFILTVLVNRRCSPKSAST